MKYKCFRYSHSLAESSCLAEAVHDSLVIMLRQSIKRRLIYLSPSSESLYPSIFPLLTRRMLLPCRAQPPFCPPSWNLLSDLCQTSTTHLCCHYAKFNEKNKVSILINGWVTANYIVSQPQFFRHLGICKSICVNLLQLMSGVITHNSVKKRSLHINKWLSYGQI